MDKRQKQATLIIFFSLTMLVTFFLGGCSTLSKADCITMDWFELGRTDGLEGKLRSTFQEYSKPCIKHGVVPNRKAYYEGHDKGLTVYCSRENGFDSGKKGLPYNPVCPEDSLFRTGYDEGIKQYWSDLGYTDGANGEMITIYQERVEAHAREGVTSNREAYRQGYGKGVATYCTEYSGFDLGKRGLPYNAACPEDSDFKVGYDQGITLFCTEANGYAIGLNGKKYHFTCPPQFEANFLRGYERGKKVREYKVQIQILENRLRQIEQRIRYRESQQHKEGLSDEQRSQIRNELRTLDIDYRDVSRELRYLNRDLEDYVSRNGIREF